MLAERTAQILACIVGEHIDTALPVGSETVVRKYHLPVSAATVRNEMARLEEDGYITHPHTSAGRIPSDIGYRYYVEYLMEEEELPGVFKYSIRQRLLDIRPPAGLRTFEDWLRMAVAVLAESVRNAALATVPRPPRCELQHLEIVVLEHGRALLIVVFNAAWVRQRILTFAEPVTQEEASIAAARLSDLFGRLTHPEVVAHNLTLSPLEEQVVEAVVEIMAAEDEALFNAAYLDGILHVFRQPEFAETKVVLELLANLQEENLPKAIPFNRLSGQDIAIIIGDENEQDVMRRCSVILTGYGAPGRASGALAVLGPTRMRYSLVIPTLRFLSQVAGEQMAQLS
jgi:heat-inducible transcriptional repressor